MVVVECVVEIQAVPRSKVPGVAGRHADGWKVRVSAPPEAGRANAAVEAVIATATGVPRRAVTVISGTTTRRKRVRIDGISAAQADERLAAAAAAMR